MTKKIAGMTGVVSAFSAGLILVLAVWISPLNFPAFQFRFSDSGATAAPSQTVIAKDDSSASASLEEVPAAEQNDDTAKKALPDSFENHPAYISGLNKASFSSSLYGVTAKSNAEKTPETLSSLVLASHLPKQELGVFEITYQITPEEYQMLLFCVEFETRPGSVEHKSLIAQVIMNRVQGEKFPSTVAEVLTSPGQFDVMPGYAECTDWTPSDRTIKAVNQVLSGTSPDYAQGALYFCNPYIVGEGNWHDTSLELICEIEGHRFYKPY